MKKLAITLNVLFLLFISGVYVSDVAKKAERTPGELRYGYRLPSKPFDWGQLGITLLFLTLPTVNLIYIVRDVGATNGNGWLSLYFQRRAAEERARIRKIEDELSRSIR